MTSALGVELETFMKNPPTPNVFTFLGFINPMPPKMRTALEQAKSDSSLY